MCTWFRPERSVLNARGRPFWPENSQSTAPFSHKKSWSHLRRRSISEHIYELLNPPTEVAAEDRGAAWGWGQRRGVGRLSVCGLPACAPLQVFHFIIADVRLFCLTTVNQMFQLPLKATLNSWSQSHVISIMEGASGLCGRESTSSFQWTVEVNYLGLR